MAYFKRTRFSGWLTAIRYGREVMKCRNAVQKQFHLGRFRPYSTRYETTIHVIKGVPTEVNILLIRAGTPWPANEWGGPRFPERVRDNDYFIHVLPTPGDMI